MSVPVIKRGLMNYINSNVFINPLNIPIYERKDSPPDFTQNSNYEEKSQLIISKIDILMKIPHKEFWCHIIYDASVLISLQSFCNNATRSYEVVLDKIELDKTQKDLYSKYYLLILRLTSNKETHIAEFSENNYGDLIYDNFIIDIPLLFDICSIYGENNTEIISKMIMHIFSCQSLYEDDLKIYALQTIKLIEEKIYAITSNNNTQQKDIHKLNYKTMSEEFTNGLLYYMIDVFHSWNIMLKAIKQKTELFEMLFKISFHKSLEQIFEKLVPFMQEKVEKFETTDPEKLKQLLSVLCFYLINLWRKIFEGNFFENLKLNVSGISTTSSEQIFLLIRECISAINSCQDHPIFADAMYLMFPLSDDFDLILQVVSQDKHEYYSDFVNESITSIVKDINCRQTMFSSKHIVESQLTPESNQDSSRTVNSEFSDIQFILDIFPDLLERDTRAYLKCYQCSPENMLEALLAGAIDVDFVKKSAAEFSDSSVFIDDVNRNILANHHNIYDGDDLDTGRVVASQLHLGKRQEKLISSLDSELKNTIMNIVNMQNEEERDQDGLEFNPNLAYDDEFDDVYGISHDVVVVDNNKTVEEISNPKAFRITNVKNFDNKHFHGNDKAVDKENGEIMEPSKLKFSDYDKRQFEKKRYQDNAIGVQNGNSAGPISKRKGSHVPKDSKYKKDHRPKFDRNNTNKAV